MKKYSLLLLALLVGCSSGKNTVNYSPFVDYEKLAYERYADQEFSTDGKTLHKLALMYSNGFGVEKNMIKAKQLWERAGEAGYAPGYCSLSKVNMDSVKNYREAYRYAYLASKASERRDCGFDFLGIVYQYGYGVKPNLNTAKDYYLLAIDWGSTNGGPESDLAVIYDSWGDTAEANKWRKIAKEKDRNESERELLIRLLELEK